MTMPAFIQSQCLLFSGKGGGVGTSLAFVVTKRALHDRKLYTNNGSPSFLFSGLTNFHICKRIQMHGTRLYEQFPPGFAQ